MHRRIIYQSLAWVPIAAGAATGAFATTSHQIVNKTVIIEPNTTYAQAIVAAAETITADKWYQPLSTPVRRPPLGAARLNIIQTATPLAADIDADMWWRQLDLPVRRRQITAEEGSLFAAPFQPAVAETITIDKWFRPLDLPMRERRRIADQQELAAPPSATPGEASGAFTTTSAMIVGRTIIFEDTAYAYFTPVVGVETITADKWWQQLTIPVRRRTIIEGIYSAAPPTPQANDQTAWHRPLDWPTRRKQLTAEEGSLFTPPGQPEARDAIGWHKPLDEPLRIKRTPTVQLGYSFIAAAPGAATALNWYAEGEPLRLKRNFQQLADAYPPYQPPAVETVTIDKWWRELDRPVRRRLIVEGAYSAAPPKPEANDTIGWYRPLEAPWRPKRLPQGAIPFEARNAFPVVPWGWYAELDKPVRLAKTPTAQIGYTFIAAAPSNGTAYNWFSPLDTPTRARQLYERPATAIPVYFVPPLPGTGNEYNWWQPLDEPIRPRPSIKTAEQWALTVPARLLTTTLENAWFVQLAEPVRLKVTFGKYPGGSIQGDPFPPIIPLSFYSYPQLDTPVRRPWLNRSASAQGNVNPVVPLAWSSIDDPRRLRPRFNVSASAQGNINPVVPFAHTYLHAPHRLKGRLNYPALAQGNVFPGAVEVGKFTQWWRQLDLPVREWRRIAWQWFTSQPPTGVGFFVEGGPADESERVACVPYSSRTAVEPDLTRTATVPEETRTAAPPLLLRVVDVPDQMRTVNSNDYRDRPCHDI